MFSRPLIAGRIPAHDLIARLAARRPVFHSEADFQHAFAQAIWQTDSALDVRLEVRQPGDDRREYLDLLVVAPDARTAIEFKYFTRRWEGAVGLHGELYALRGHAAADLARLGFVRDIARVERFASAANGNGLAIMLTNEPALWSTPRRADTRDSQFRIHDGQTLTGALRWGQGDYPANNHVLAGAYTCRWQHYSVLPDDAGRLRYLLVEAGGPG